MKCEFCDAMINPATGRCVSCGPEPSTADASALQAPTGPTLPQTGAIKLRSLGPFVIIYFMTAGLYFLYLMGSTWPEQFNQLRGDKKYNQSMITVLYILTCGLALFYYAFQFMGDLEEYANRLGLPENPGKGTMKAGIVVWLIPYLNWVLAPWHLWQIQKELNRLATVHNQGQYT